MTQHNNSLGDVESSLVRKKIAFRAPRSDETFLNLANRQIRILEASRARDLREQMTTQLVRREHQKYISFRSDSYRLACLPAVVRKQIRGELSTFTTF